MTDYGNTSKNRYSVYVLDVELKVQCEEEKSILLKNFTSIWNPWKVEEMFKIIIVIVQYRWCYQLTRYNHYYNKYFLGTTPSFLF